MQPPHQRDRTRDDHSRGSDARAFCRGGERDRGHVGRPLSTGAVIRCIAVEGYRSLRSVYVSLRDLTVVTGGNGSGKSSLYRVLSLLAATARGEVMAPLAREGGLESTLWAGPERISGSMPWGTAGPGHVAPRT